MSEKEKTFLEIMQSPDNTWFWTEDYKGVWFSYMETFYKKSIVREWRIADVVPNGDKFLVKWEKRIQPLTEMDLQKKYS